MYRGVIQESTWAQPGSYLYSQIMSKGLNKNVKNGRIYRLVYEGIKPGPKPDLLTAPLTRLITYLDHPNGWWRDNAQKEIIIRGNTSVVPALEEILTGKTTQRLSSLGKLHALWTLQGLDALSKPMLLQAMQDTDAQVRKAAVRISESYVKKSDEEVIAKLATLQADTSHEVIVQLVLSLHNSHDQKARQIVEDILAKHKDDKMLAAVQKSLQKNEEAKKYGSTLLALNESGRSMVMQGAGIFKSLCAGCHGGEGEGLPTAIAPPLVSKFKLIEHKKGVIKILLHGLHGPVEGKTFPDMMPPMGDNDDLWIASVLNYVRYDLCMRSFPKMNQGYIDWVIIKPEDVKKVREEYASRKEPWTWSEIEKTKD
jgi:mono/diheme cytochrome c family protein